MVEKEDVSESEVSSMAEVAVVVAATVAVVEVAGRFQTEVLSVFGFFGHCATTCPVSRQ